ncbi:MAG: T9SS type A sorting domain-containing protein [Bacteroidota bacterium]
MSITTLSKNWILLISTLIYLGLGAGALSAQTSPTLPIDFEDGAIDYNPAPFGDAVVAIIANPDMNGNMSDTVLNINKPEISATFTGISMDFATAVDLNAGTAFTMKVWSPRAGVTIRFKLEDAGNAAIFSEIDAVTTVASGWETLTFDIGTAPTFDASHMYTRIALFPDFGNGGQTGGENFFMDDIEQVMGQMSTMPTLPITFEDGAVDYNPAPFGDAVVAIIANPDMNGNMSDTVLNINKPEVSATFTGISMDLASAIDLSAGSAFTMKVWSPRAGVTIRFKVEDAGNAAIFSEIDAVTTVASGWETLTFDIGTAPTFDPSHMYSRIALFPDFGNGGQTGGENFFMDDIEQVMGQMLNLPTLPITFEDGAIDYNPAPFGDAVVAIIANPDMNGNASDTVLNINKPEVSATFTGISMDLASAIDLSAGTAFTMKVWSPRAGVTIRFKLEDAGNAAIFSEIDAVTTVASGWETLTFDIGTAPTFDPSHMYSRIALFPDFGNGGQTGGEDFFMDDIEQVMGQMLNLPTLPITFEDGAIDYNPTPFGDAMAMIIANPDMNGNMSDTVLNFNKPENAQTFAGVSMNLADPIDLSKGTEFSVKAWAPRAGLTFLFKLENADGSKTTEVDTVNVGASTWETLVFDVSMDPNYDPTASYTKIVIFPDFNAAGQVGGEDFYLDDFEQFQTVAPDPVKLPIDFESATADYAPAGFGDATAEVVDNPDMTGNTSAKVLTVTKPSGAQTWAGVSIALDEVVDLSPGAVFSVDVWSPAAGTPILLKFEDTTSPPDGNGNPSIFSELEVPTTAAMSWETLSFDMSTAPTYDASHNYNQVVIFPNFGTSPSADETYYMDNILNVNAVSIDPDLFANAAFKLYPNPAKQDLNIDFNLPLSGDLSFEVMDMMGRVVKRVNVGLRVQGDHSERFQLNEIQSGAYLLLMKIDGDYVKQEKLIIQK